MSRVCPVGQELDAQHWEQSRVQGVLGGAPACAAPWSPQPSALGGCRSVPNCCASTDLLPKRPPPPSPCVPARTKGHPSSLPIPHPAPLGTPAPVAMLGGVVTTAPSPLSEPDFPGDLTPPAPLAVTGGPGRSCRGGWRMARRCLHPSWQLRGAAALRRTLSPGKSPAQELPPHGCGRTGPWHLGPCLWVLLLAVPRESTATGPRLRAHPMAGGVGRGSHQGANPKAPSSDAKPDAVPDAVPDAILDAIPAGISCWLISGPIRTC